MVFFFGRRRFGLVTPLPGFVFFLMKCRVDATTWNLRVGLLCVSVIQVYIIP